MARSEWEIFGDVARRVDPERAELATFESGEAIRDEIARVVPSYAGIEQLEKTGDAVQWGGAHLCEGGVFPTPDGRGAFTVVAPVDTTLGPNRLRLSTRRGKQFNTIVFAERDPLTGANRDSVFVSSADAERLGLHDGDGVVVRSEHGEMAGKAFVTDRAGQRAGPVPRGERAAAVGEARAAVARARLHGDRGDRARQRVRSTAGMVPMRPAWKSSIASMISVARVHEERPVVRDRLADREAAEQQHLEVR